MSNTGPIERPTPAEDKRVVWVAVAALICLHAALLAWAASRNSVAYDEFAHLPAGMAYWKHGELSIYNQTPPLLRWWGALPPLLAGAVAPDPAGAMKYPLLVRYWAYGDAFQRANFDRYQWLFFLGRLGLIPLSCLGAWLVYRYAAELHGNRWSGVGACAMYALCPNIAAHASLIGTDAGSAVAILAAVWLWRRFCQRPTLGRAMLAGVVFGLAHLCKFYAMLLWPMAVVMAGCSVFALIRRSDNSSKNASTTTPSPGTPGEGRVRVHSSEHEASPSNNPQTLTPTLSRRTGRGGRMADVFCYSRGLLICLAITWLLVNIAYGFKGTFATISSYKFEGVTLTALSRHLPGATPIPLPRNFIEGYDAAAAEVESLFPGYLMGKRYRGARWDYYPIALACKLPVATIVILVLAAEFGAMKLMRSRQPRTDNSSPKMATLPPLLALIVFAAGLILLAKINIGIRYLLPIFPLAFVLAAGIFARGRLRFVGFSLVLLLLIENLGSAPRYISFYNFAVGRGYPIVSDFDWGQSLIDLRDWMHDNEVPTIMLAYNGRVDPHAYGIRYVPLSGDDGPPAVAISGYYLTGIARPMMTPAGLSVLRIPFSDELMDREPTATLGSILIYRREDLMAAQQAWLEKNRGRPAR